MIRQFTRWDQTLDQTRRCTTLIHSTWHGTCLLVRFPNLGTPNLVAQFGGPDTLFKLETPTHFKSRISGSTCPLCNFYIAIKNLLQTII